MHIGDLLAKIGASSQKFEARTSRAHGGMTGYDIAAALGTVRSKPAVALIMAKYVDHHTQGFNIFWLINEYRRTITYSLRRVDTIVKLAHAALAFYTKDPRCRRCHGQAEEWDKESLRFIKCKLCLGLGNRVASNRDIAKLSGMSRSKVKSNHAVCFWQMYMILSIWESTAADQVKRSLR